jgi:hypothetical protein
VAVEPARRCADDPELALHALEVGIRRETHLVPEPCDLACCDRLQHAGLGRREVERRERRAGQLRDGPGILACRVAQDDIGLPLFGQRVDERHVPMSWSCELTT